MQGLFNLLYLGRAWFGFPIGIVPKLILINARHT